MNDQEQRRAAASAVALLAVTFDKDMSDEQIDIYINNLCDLEADKLHQAVQIVIQEERFFPAIATIRAAANHDPDQMSAEEAWGFVCRRIQAEGRMAGTRGLTDQTVKAIDSCGGWVTLCESTNPIGDRIAFVRSYASANQRAARQKVTVPNRLKAAINAIGRGGQ